MNIARLAAPGLAVCLTAGTVLADSTIDSIQGLEAWYKIGTPDGRSIRDGEPIKIWRDSTGNGHHLNGVRAVYRVRGQNDRTVVEIGKGAAYSVTTPFELGDHTVFLVYAASREERALMQSSEDGEDHFGIVLRGKGNHDLYRTGQQSFAYNATVPLEDDFNITVLGRAAGRLRSFVNGADVSSNIELQDPIHVGRFFQLSRTRFVKLDGDGLAIAEMIFFDRYLADEERDGVTRYLAEKYEIDLWNTAEAVRRLGPTVALASSTAFLSTDSSQDLNVPEATRIAWNIQNKLEAPLVHDPAKDPTRIHCAADETRVRVFVSLSMTTSVAGADVRVLVLKNESEYHVEEVSSGPMAEPGATATVQLEVELALNKGDYLGIVTMREGAAGTVALESGQALLGIKARY